MARIKFSLFDISSFLLGLTCIIEVLRINVGGVMIYLCDAFFFLVLLNILIRCKNAKLQFFDKSIKQLYCQLITVLLFGLNFITPIIDSVLNPECNIDGISPAIKYAIKSLLNIIFILALFYCCSSVKQRRFCDNFLKGFCIGVFIHILYSTYQLVSWYILGEDVHTPFMASLGITEESLDHPVVNWVMRPLVIRTQGIFWDPYYMGIMGTVGMFVSLSIKRKWIESSLFILSFVNFMMSFSRTGYLACIAVLVMIFIFSRRNKSLKGIVNFRKIIISLLSSIVLTSAALPFVLDNDAKEEIQVAFTYKTKVKADDEGDMRHIMYPLYVMDAVLLQDPMHMVMGYGGRNSSRAIYHAGHIQDLTNTPESYDIETDWFKIMANYGIICFIIFISFNIKLIIKVGRMCDFRTSLLPFLIITSVTAVFVSGCFYVVNDSKWVWLLYAVSIMYLNIITKERTICK